MSTMGLDPGAGLPAAEQLQSHPVPNRDASFPVWAETIIGMLSPDGHTAVMLDDDGQYSMTLVDPNTIDMCYHHLYPTSKVVACFQAKRTP